MFELYLHYYRNKGYPSDIILLDTKTQQYYAWIALYDKYFDPNIGSVYITSGWNKIKPVSLGDYIKASPLSFLILTGKDYYSTLPKGVDNAKR